MADTVSFKVFLTKEEEADETARPEVRRFGIDKDVVSNFLYLSEKLQTVFSALRGRHFTISWRDNDGDTIVISSDEELKIALAETSGQDIRKLYVNLHSEYPEGEEPERDLPRTLHVGITCDGCNKSVQGFRYKCIQCPDFDLCADCEVKGLHPEHCMIRTAVPLQWRPHFGRRLAHHMNKFARKSGQCAGKDNKETSECPNKKGKFHHGGHGGHEGHGHGGHGGHGHGGHEGHGHGGGHGGHGHGGRGGHGHGGGGHGGHGHGGHSHDHHGRRGDRPSWLDTLATYLNDWAYLPGEGDCPMQDPSSGEESNTDRDDNGSGNTSGNGSGQEKPRTNPHAELFKNIGDNLASLLDPLGIDVEVLPNKGQSANEKSGANTEAEKNPPSTSTPKFPGEGKKLVDRTPAAGNNPADTPPPPASAPAAGPSIENEGWTLLNQQDTASPTAPTPASGAIPKQPSAEVPAASPSPPTSVLASAPATQPIYPQLPQLTVPPVIYHSDPKIQRSVVAMMQMGFSNEGGWLTHLLASMNGDISKALDILQPVRPNVRK